MKSKLSAAFAAATCVLARSRLGLTILTAVLLSFQQPASTQAASIIVFPSNTIDFGNVPRFGFELVEVTINVVPDPRFFAVINWVVDTGTQGPLSLFETTCPAISFTCNLVAFFQPTSEGAFAEVRQFTALEIGSDPFGLPLAFQISGFLVLQGVSIAPPPTPVPGPIVGAGLPGLILACGVLLFLARRRHQIA
jgi:hypothetical protein